MTAVLALFFFAAPGWTPGPSPAADFEVLTHEGKTVRFFQDLVRSKNVAVNFIFTSCRAVCPASTASFARLRTLLGTEAGVSAHLVSISVDPVRDTPAVLRAYAAKFGGAATGWTFVTGDPQTIARLLTVLSANGAQGAPEVHARGVAVFRGSSGEWTWTSESNSPAHIRALLAEASVSAGLPKQAAK